MKKNENKSGRLPEFAGRTGAGIPDSGTGNGGSTEFESGCRIMSAGRGWLALSPLLVFLCIYLVTSMAVNDFYKVPITVAFLVAACYAVAVTSDLPLQERIRVFSKGAGDRNILLMIWIFVLAGAFAQGAKEVGCIDATVSLALYALPGEMLLAGFFLAACFISLSIGTSVGTIVALMPVAAGLAEKTGMSAGFLAAIVVGGAFFGDNLSFISDTTIAATKTVGCRMKDKFHVNLRIVLPAALIVLGIYLYKGSAVEHLAETEVVEWWKVLPYLTVLVLALTGMDVMLILAVGILATGLIGISFGTGLFNWTGALGNGITGMGELVIVTLLAGGLLELVRHNGGIDFIVGWLTRRIGGKRAAEFSIAGLVSLANLCTANNTIAIITTGGIAREMAVRFGLDKRKTASILDTFSCLVQGIIPYGAQLLLAAGLARISPFDIIGYLYYPFCMGAFAVLSILFRYPRKYS